MFNLFMLLLERMGLIILLAYILMNINYCKNIMNQREQLHAKVKLIFILVVSLSCLTLQEFKFEEMKLSVERYTNICLMTRQWLIRVC